MKGSNPLLTKESERSTLQSVVRMGTRQTLESRLGKAIYAFALYEKVKRAHMMLPYGNILMVPFDTSADHEPIILKKERSCRCLANKIMAGTGRVCHQYSPVPAQILAL